MNQLASKVPSRGVTGRSRALDVDRYVSLRIRQRRIMLGLTQQQMAELIGVTYQQAHKYETGINRISAGRLYQIAKALGVDISYFFEDVDPGNTAATRAQELMPQQRMLLELARNFAAIKSRKHQEALCHLARVLSDSEQRAARGSGSGSGSAS
jgi:transcriptional regulator with XRE-family HTH domain